MSYLRLQPTLWRAVWIALRCESWLRPGPVTRRRTDLFLKAMKEVGLEVPSPDAARRGMVRSWAAQIVDGELDPYEGARRIWCQGWEPLGSPPDLTVFVGLASEWEDDPESREAYESEIIAAARELCGDGRE